MTVRGSPRDRFGEAPRTRGQLSLAAAGVDVHSERPVRGRILRLHNRRVELHS
jgi:hypothetical protein